METLIPIFGILMIIAVVLGPIWLSTRAKSEEQARMHQTLRAAFDKGQAIPPEIFESLRQEKPVRSSPERDLRGGVIWLAVGVGLAIFAALMGMEEDDALYPMLGIASIPGMVGLALIVLSFVGRERHA